MNLVKAIEKLNNQIKSGATLDETRNLAYRVYISLDDYIKEESLNARTLKDLSDTDEFRVVRTMLRKKFRFK